MKPLPWILAGLLLPSGLWAQRTLVGNEACTALVQEGIRLVHQNRFNEALDLFARAEKADPTASGPLSGRAVAFYEASLRTTQDLAEDYRAKAGALAAAALAREPRDPLALDLVQFLEEGPPRVRHAPKAEAGRLVAEGEVLFSAKNYGEAKAKYLAAFERDSQYARALVFAGDCDYCRKDYPKAVELFRRAVQVDPLDEKGWRYLADTLLAEGQMDPAREALVAGISALPRYLPSWTTLAGLPGTGPAWKSLALKPRARAVKDPKSGKYTVVLDPELTRGKSQDSADVAVWLMYGLAQVAAANPAKAGEPVPTPFRKELETWNRILQVAEELTVQGKRLTDPVLLQMQTFRKAGDLEVGLYLLAFKEAYRNDFEAWKTAHPNGVRTFLDTYRIRP